MVETSALKMDRIYRFQRHVYDATRAYYLLGRDQLIADLDAHAPGTKVLEVACGTGRNLVKVAERYPSAKVYGFDISEKMLETAVLSIARRGLSSRVHLAAGDGTNFDPQNLFGVDRFDRIFVSYALSMIPDWRACVVEALSYLAPGGQMMIVDFGEFSGFPRAMRSAQTAWLRKFSVTPIETFEVALAALAKEHGCTYEGREIYRGYSVVVRISAPVDLAGRGG